MEKFREKLQSNVTLPAKVSLGEIGFQKKGTSLVKAYFTSNSLLTAEIRRVAESEFLLEGWIAVPKGMRTLIQMLVLVGTFFGLIGLVKYSFLTKPFWFCFAFVVGLTSLMFSILFANYILTRKQRELIVSAFLESALN